MVWKGTAVVTIILQYSFNGMLACLQLLKIAQFYFYLQFYHNFFFTSLQFFFNFTE